MIPLSLGEAVDAEAPAGDGDDRDDRPDPLGGPVEEGRQLVEPGRHGSRSTASRPCSSYTNSDAASLTWQDAGQARGRRQGRLQHHGRLAGRVLQRHEGWRQPRPEAERRLRLDAVPGTDSVYDWLSDSFTLPKGAPHRSAAVKWLGFLGSKRAQDTFNPVKGSIPARQDANAKLYGPYLKWALKQWKNDKLAGSLAHGVVARNRVDDGHRHGPRAVPAEQGRGEVPGRARRRRRRSARKELTSEEHSAVGTRVAPGLPVDRPHRGLRLRAHRLERQGVAQRLAHVRAFELVGPALAAYRDLNADPAWSEDLHHILLFTVDVHRRRAVRRR